MLENKIANSGLIVLDLEDYFPTNKVVGLDISQFLFSGLILKEKDFRSALKSFDWSIFQDKIVAVHCSTDAIVPQWAFMLLTTYLQPIAEDVFYGNTPDVEEKMWLKSLNGINIEQYHNERIIIKGCGKLNKTGSAYIEISKLLLPVVKSLMFGEPCSTVPVYKRK